MATHTALAVGVALLLALLVGCGGSSTESGLRALRAWVADTEGVAIGVEDGAHGATGFRPEVPPLGPTELEELSTVGVPAGRRVQESTDRVTHGTNLDSEEAKNLTCYLMTKAANGELSLEPARLEEEVLGYIGERFVEQVPVLDFQASVAGLAEAVLEAESEGEAAFDTALATACL